VNGTNLPGNAQNVYCIMRRSYNCPAGVTQVLKIDGRKVSWFEIAGEPASPHNYDPQREILTFQAEALLSF
jgi:hypothetical protein